MSKLIVFDVDGTVLDSYGMYENVLRFYSKENNLPMPCFQAIKAGYAYPDERDFKWGMPIAEQRAHLFKTYSIADEWSMSGHVDKTPKFFDGAIETFIHLKDLGHRLAIVTSKGEAPLKHLLEHHDVGKYFCAYRTWNDIVGRGEAEKPAPDQLQSVIRELKADVAGTVMVGDTTMDIEMGLNAQVKTIGVTWGSHDKDILLNAGAHHIVETKVSDIVSVVEKVLP